MDYSLSRPDDHSLRTSYTYVASTRQQSALILVRSCNGELAVSCWLVVDESTPVSLLVWMEPLLVQEAFHGSQQGFCKIQSVKLSIALPQVVTTADKCQPQVSSQGLQQRSLQRV